MNNGNVDLLAEKWLNDPVFRAKLKRDPDETVKNCGMTLSTEEWKALRDVVRSTPAEALT